MQVATPGTLRLSCCGDQATEAAGERMRTAFASAGLVVHEHGELAVVVCDDYLNPALFEHIAGLEAEPPASGAFVLVTPLGVRPLLGPLLRAHDGPCLACLQVAMASNSLAPARAPRTLDPNTAAMCALTAVALHAVLASDGAAAHPLLARVLAWEPNALTLTSHQVRRRPQCRRCGNPALMTRVGATPLTLTQSAHGRLRDGGARSEDPLEAQQRLASSVSNLLGPIRELTEATKLHSDAPSVCFSRFSIAVPSDGPSGLSEQICSGKGWSAAQARMSAIGEALERYAGIYQGDEARVHASYDVLIRADQEVLHALLRNAGLSTSHAPIAILLPDDLQLFSARQLAEPRLDAHGGERVPQPYPHDQPIAWTPVWSISEARMALAPLAAVYSRTPDALGATYAAPSSNGSAAGASLVEAALQGLYELVERDAVAIWWYNRLLCPELTLSALGLPAYQTRRLERFRGACARLGLETWALDLTHDLGIPVAVAVAYRSEDRAFAFGFGAHHDWGTCVGRAFSELAQLIASAASREPPWHVISRIDHAFLRPSGRARDETLSGSSCADLEADERLDLTAALKRAVAELAARGLRVFVANKTRPDLDLAVVQVIVPGLRHVWPRLGPGRLYDVPVQLGRLPRALRERELNPVPLLV